MEALYQSWQNSKRLFNITTEESKSYADLFLDVKNSREKLKQRFKGQELFVLEAANDYQTFIKFLSCLLEKKVVFMSAAYQFQDPEFRSLLENETQSHFLYIASNQSLENASGESNTNNALIKAAQEKGLPVFLVRTSGTSGNKFKFIAHDADNFIKKYHQVKNHFDKTIAFSPADTIAGVETLLEAITHQNVLVSDKDKITPHKAAELIARFQVDYFQTTPSFLNLMLIAKAFDPAKMSGLKKVAYGSEPALSSSLLAIKNSLPNLEFKHTYGMSEIGILATITDQADPGRFSFNESINQSKIEEDSLYILTSTRMLGYLNYANQPEGWFKTGDAAKRDEDGYIKILGRSDDLINLAGRKFYPHEVEDLLIRVAGAEDVSVIAEKNALIGNIIVAKFLISENEDEDQFRERLKIFCEKSLPTFMCPHKIIVTREPFITSRFKKERKL